MNRSIYIISDDKPFGSRIEVIKGISYVPYSKSMLNWAEVSDKSFEVLDSDIRTKMILEDFIKVLDNFIANKGDNRYGKSKYGRNTYKSLTYKIIDWDVDFNMKFSSTTNQRWSRNAKNSDVYKVDCISTDGKIKIPNIEISTEQMMYILGKCTIKRGVVSGITAKYYNNVLVIDPKIKQKLENEYNETKKIKIPKVKEKPKYKFKDIERGQKIKMSDGTICTYLGRIDCLINKNNNQEIELDKTLKEVFIIKRLYDFDPKNFNIILKSDKIKIREIFGDDERISIAECDKFLQSDINVTNYNPYFDSKGHIFLSSQTINKFRNYAHLEYLEDDHEIVKFKK